MTAGEQHPRPRPLAFCRKIEQGGDVMIWQALKQNFLHAVTTAVKFPGDLGIKGRFLWERAQQFAVIIPEFGQVLLQRDW